MTSNTGSFTFGRAAPTIPVSDIDRALAFYVDILGMKQVFANGDPVGFVILKREDAEVHITRMPDHKGTTANVMHLLVDDATALHDHVSSAGVRIVKGIRDAEFGLRCFVMADPDGNRIDVGEAL